ncbi:MAG: hypothetical protein IJY94_06275 [Clostridia bacterium]|nr:hypothetical protein [Clostridia bacterium]
MNRTNAMEFLKQYDTLQKSCQIIDEQMFDTASLLGEIKREENLSRNTQNESVTRRVDKYVSHLTDEYKHLSIRKKLLTHRLKQIESVVNALPKNERKVAERFFLSTDKHHAAEELMEELEFEKTQIYRIRTRALDMIGEMISNIPLSKDAYDET